MKRESSENGETCARQQELGYPDQRKLRTQENGNDLGNWETGIQLNGIQIHYRIPSWKPVLKTENRIPGHGRKSRAQNQNWGPVNWSPD